MTKSVVEKKSVVAKKSAEPVVPLTQAEIQTRLDALAVAMVAKALPAPTAEFTLRSQAGSKGYISWTRKGTSMGKYEFFHGDAHKVLADAEAYVAALPSPEKARMQAFLEALGEAIVAGKLAGVDAEFVNPLTVMMKQLSKNALTHQPAA